jgi:broad specificity phosphatase PhoE
MARREPIVLSLVRCGESAWASNGRMEGAADLPLADEGTASVAADAARLDPRGAGVVFHPADEAAAETARIVAEAVGARTKAVGELGDPHLGLLEGLTESEFAERFPKRYKQWQEDPLSMTPPEGEEIAEARHRIFAAVARLLRRSRHDEVAVVLHRLGTGLLACWLADRPASELWPVLRARPRVERYLLTVETIDRLEEEAAAQASGVK